MRCAVKTKTSKAVALGKVAGNGVAPSVFGHRLVKGGVKDRHLREPRQGGFGGSDALEVCGIVEGGQRHAGGDGGFHLVVDEDAGSKTTPTMDHAMANSDDIKTSGRHFPQECLDGDFVISARNGLLCALVIDAALDEGLWGAHALHAGGERVLLGSIVKDI